MDKEATELQGKSRKLSRERVHLRTLYLQAKKDGDWKQAQDYLFRLWQISVEQVELVEEFRPEL